MLISNPLADPLFPTTALLVGGFLAATLAALLAIARFSVSRLTASVLFARWRVWAIIAPLYCLALFCGTLTTLTLLLLLIFQGLREYVQLVSLPRSYATVLLGAGLLVAPVATISPDAFYLLAPLLLLVATLQPLLFRTDGTSVRHLAFAVLGFGYIPFLLGHFMLLDRDVPGGLGVLLATGLGTGMSDVGAYVVGKRFGHRKLAPAISPNKTWAGLVGNLFGAYVGIALLSYALPEDLRAVLVAALPPVIALGAVWGDLLESSIKREFGAKDAGAWLPGFGGLLDRIDSLIIVVPLVYYVLRLSG